MSDLFRKGKLVLGETYAEPNIDCPFSKESDIGQADCGRLRKSKVLLFHTYFSAVQ